MVIYVKIAICDYSQAFLRAFRTELEKNNEASELWLFNNYDDLLNSSCCRKLECVFIATEINGASGIDAALKLKQLNHDAEIVFITENCGKYAQQIFSYSDIMRPFSMFVKPVSRSFMKRTLEMLRNTVVYRSSTVLSIKPIDCETVSVISEDIHYIEHNNRISTLHTVKGNIETRSVIPFFDEKLPKEQFIHAAKSLIVNLKFVEHTESGRIVLKDGTMLFPTRNYRQAFERSFLDYINRMNKTAEKMFI